MSAPLSSKKYNPQESVFQNESPHSLCTSSLGSLARFAIHYGMKSGSEPRFNYTNWENGVRFSLTKNKEVGCFLSPCKIEAWLTFESELLGLSGKSAIVTGAGGGIGAV